MEKTDLGEVKTTIRIRNGVKQVIRLYNKKQRKLIIEAVEKRPDGMTIEEALNVYKLSPAVYYSWLRNESKGKKDDENKLPNPFEETLKSDNEFTSTSQLRAFYESNSPELKAFIEMKFQEWEKTDLITQIMKRITPENISEVAKVGNITVDELKSFLQRKNKNLAFYSVEAIRRYLQL